MSLAINFYAYTEDDSCNVLFRNPCTARFVCATRFEIDERGVSPTSNATIPGYERYDAHVFYKGIKDVEINLTVRNVTDEVYVEGADRIGAYAQFGSPAAALLNVSYVIH